MATYGAITLTEVKQLLDEAGRDKVRLIDIRTPAEFDKQHIPIAENIPAEKLNDASFQHDETLVCVCNHGKERSQQAAALLGNKGYGKVYYLSGGTAGWFIEQQ